MIGVGIGIENELRVSVGPVLTEKESGDGGKDEDGDPEEEGRLERISDLAGAFHPFVVGFHEGIEGKARDMSVSMI